MTTQLNNIQELISEELMTEALTEVLKEKTHQRINLKEFFPNGKIETKADFKMMRQGFHKMSKDHPQRNEILSMLREFPRPTDSLARELFEMDSANYVWSDDSVKNSGYGHSFMLGKD